jgi:hypothetical protein
MGRKICGVCNRDFSLEHNRLGLVVDNEVFVCEVCNKHLHDEDKELFSPSTVMHDPRKEMPIALWLIKEQNKDKPFMSMKR